MHMRSAIIIIIKNNNNTSAVSTKLKSADLYGLPCSDRSNSSKVITTLAFNN